GTRDWRFWFSWFKAERTRAEHALPRVCSRGAESPGKRATLADCETTRLSMRCGTCDAGDSKLSTVACLAPVDGPSGCRLPRIGPAACDRALRPRVTTAARRGLHSRESRGGTRPHDPSVCQPREHRRRIASRTRYVVGAGQST